MKKVLMVMGFALCASVAFAQTARISDKDIAKKSEKAPVNAVKAAVDYKASVFAKANGHDTITVFKFDVASDYTIGTITNSDRINDTLVGNANANSINIDAAKWKRYSSTANFRSQVASQQPQLAAMWQGGAVDDIIADMTSSTREPDDDGFMVISYQESSQTTGRINTYFTLPTVARPADAVMIEVSITQSFAKYYDRCFIDYQVGGQWYAREINVDGIDAAVNTWSPTRVRYVMPYNLNPETNINLRIRAFSTHRGSTWGYFWAVDNVAVLKLTQTEFWSLNSPTNIDGFYGMLPEGMSIPMTWGVEAQNLSINNINNAKATLNAGSSRTSLSQVLQGPAVNVTAGNFDTTYSILINERGFFNQNADVTSGYQSWPNHSSNYGNTTGTLNGGFQGRGLPATTTGKNFYNINVAGGNLSHDYDTILYWVSPMQSFASTSTRESGHRWSHDNGIIPVGASFQTAFADREPGAEQAFVTDRGSDPETGAHVSMEGYAVHARFITGNDIPEGWVFRGIELIAATDRQPSNLEAASIVPIAYVDDYRETDDGTSLYFESLPCGIDGRAFEVQEDEINANLVENNMGYLTPDQAYKAINIKFIEQPEIQPNTSYRFGYRLNGDADFAIAGTRRTFSYTAANDTTYNIGFGYGIGVNDTNAEFAAVAANANDYRYVPTPATYLEVMAFDPIENSYVTAWNIDNYPMIRPIVGPARASEHALLGAICDNNTETHGVKVSRGNDEICGRQIQITAGVGSSHRVDFDPIGDHSVIDSVLLNGVKLQPYDEATGEGDYFTGDATVYRDPEHPDPSQILLSREFWVVYLSDVVADEEYEFTVFSHYEEFDVGIDPVAPDAILCLAPNPATSSVKLNLKGVEGKVNCSILDMSGRVIYNADINAEAEHMINVSNLPAGAYFVRVTNDTFSKIEKLIIK